MTDEKYQLVVIRHKRDSVPYKVELVNKYKFDFTDYVFLRKNEDTGYEEYCHKDDYDLYQK
jgi:hypothetical protein